MSTGDYAVPPKVPAWEVQGYVFYMGGASRSRTSTAPSIGSAKSHILFRWAREDMKLKIIPIGAQVVVTSTKKVFVYSRTRALVTR